MTDIYQFLKDRQISYDRYDHPAVFTVEESEKLCGDIPGVGACKNLFLRNRKGDRHYLVVVDKKKRVDLKSLALQLGEKDVSFASPERLMKYLGVTPGSVSLLALINDIEKAVGVCIDADMWSGDSIHAHPLTNTATLVIPRDEMKRFVKETGHEINLVVIKCLGD